MTSVRYLTEDDFRAHHHFDLCDEHSIRSVKIHRDAELRDLVAELARVLGLRKERIRLWEWVTRENQSRRPDALWSEADMAKRISDCQTRDKLTVYVEQSILDAGVVRTVSN